MKKIDMLIIAFFIVIIISSCVGINRYFRKIDEQLNTIKQQREVLDREYEDLHNQVEDLLKEEIIWENSL